MRFQLCAGSDLESDGQALAALGTASVDDLAAVLGAHASQETVHAAALTLLGLESTLHSSVPPIKNPGHPRLRICPEMVGQACKVLV